MAAMPAKLRIEPYDREPIVIDLPYETSQEVRIRIEKCFRDECPVCYRRCRFYSGRFHYHVRSALTSEVIRNDRFCFWRSGDFQRDVMLWFNCNLEGQKRAALAF
jgi:hypothetical protein